MHEAPARNHVLQRSRREGLHTVVVHGTHSASAHTRPQPHARPKPCGFGNCWGTPWPQPSSASGAAWRAWARTPHRLRCLSALGDGSNALVAGAGACPADDVNHRRAARIWAAGATHHGRRLRKGGQTGPRNMSQPHPVHAAQVYQNGSERQGGIRGPKPVVANLSCSAPAPQVERAMRDPFIDLPETTLRADPQSMRCVSHPSLQT